MNPHKLGRLFPHASKSFIKRNSDSDTGIRATKPEFSPGLPLVDSGKGEAQGRACFEVCFNVYAVRPLDWDNYRFKDLQDCLVEAGILSGDDWRILQGRVISHKAHSKEEERTEVTIGSV